MTAMLASGQYEWKSLGVVYQGNSIKAFSVAVVSHTVLVVLFIVLGPIDHPKAPDRIPDVHFTGYESIRVTSPAAPQIKIAGSLRAAEKGIIVPVNEIDDIEKNLRDVENSGTAGLSDVEGPGNSADGIPGDEGVEATGFPEGAIDLTKDWTGSLEKFPIPIREVKPEYPDLARKLGIEGTVIVKILIDKNGKPDKAEIYKGVNELLNEAAMQAALKWLFVPAVMNNNTVSVWVAVPFRFRVVDK